MISLDLPVCYSRSASIRSFWDWINSNVSISYSLALSIDSISLAVVSFWWSSLSKSSTGLTEFKYFSVSVYDLYCSCSSLINLHILLISYLLIMFCLWSFKIMLLYIKFLQAFILHPFHFSSNLFHILCFYC